MKIQTIQKYIDLMKSMLDSDATSLADYCARTGISYHTFNIQLNAIKKQITNYYEECNTAIQLWEEVKEHFKENRNKCKTPSGIRTIAESNLNLDKIGNIEAYNETIRQEIRRLEGLLITEEKLELIPEKEADTVDERYWDEL